MKAAVFKRADLLVVEDIPMPKAGRGELVVKVHYCGICGSDLHRYHYGLMAPGVVMGHEYSGVVAEVGEGVQGWQVGDRVIRGIRAGLLGARYSAREKGFTMDTQLPGGYAEYCLAPAATLLPLPESLSDEVASLSEPLAVGVHAVRLSSVKLGDVVVVLGAGPIGLLTLQSVLQLGPRLLIVSEPVAGRRELALKLGADVAIDPRQVDPVAECVRLADGLGPDVVFECAGAKPTLQQALEMARKRGQVVLVALCMEGCQVSPLDWVGREVQLQCAYGSEPVDWTVSLGLLRSGRVQGEPVISKVVPLAEIQAAFQGLLHPTDELQVLVRP
ncbi:MAG: zinc-binding dehydrogenase [Chloroflexi bacterium]|nr:zinc-binding dehydrogenase [Chloroflexota bacterium]